MTETPTRHFVISTEAKRSGEIPLSHGMQQAGDLSTQRFNSPEVFIPIPPCPSARDDGGSRQHTVISKGQMTETTPCPVVISTEAGQPPIGKPLIVQARGQLRLTWRLYAESPQSGEISRLKWQKRCLPLVISAKAEQQNLTSPWYTRMAAGSPSSQGHNKRAVGNDFHFPQPLLPVSGYSYFST